MCVFHSVDKYCVLILFNIVRYLQLSFDKLVEKMTLNSNDFKKQRKYTTMFTKVILFIILKDVMMVFLATTA